MPAVLGIQVPTTGLAYSTERYSWARSDTCSAARRNLWHMGGGAAQSETRASKRQQSGPHNPLQPPGRQARVVRDPRQTGVAFRVPWALLPWDMGRRALVRVAKIRREFVPHQSAATEAGGWRRREAGGVWRLDNAAERRGNLHSTGRRGASTAVREPQAGPPRLLNCQSASGLSASGQRVRCDAAVADLNGCKGEIGGRQGCGGEGGCWALIVACLAAMGFSHLPKALGCAPAPAFVA